MIVYLLQKDFFISINQTRKKNIQLDHIIKSIVKKKLSFWTGSLVIILWLWNFSAPDANFFIPTWPSLGVYLPCSLTRPYLYHWSKHGILYGLWSWGRISEILKNWSFEFPAIHWMDYHPSYRDENSQCFDHGRDIHLGLSENLEYPNL